MGRASTSRRSGAQRAEFVGAADWYKDAIIYEVHVRAFQDSDGDGVGDFKGLTSRLGYLQDLGVTAIWLLPFYPSPLRDDGYDIADYAAVNPDYGTMADFRRFVSAAHKRDLRVITELVINHTSDQHPWFQRARKEPKGSRYRDYYVWSDTPEKYPGVRIIFKDTEFSNWAWDPVAEQYYWHRFFSHQPDLNFDNPEVRERVKEVMDFWFEAGVDGMRLDAVPYLVERDGTNCENLPETFDVIRELRAHLDERWPGRMFLAEANQWPEDAIAYFGDGDMCHMNFHFPLMPRLFMSLRMEDSFPTMDILAQTPEIPESCQWAMFLRNHDELTLEMVTDEERDYMYRSYASDPQMRINLGIRRRLAPLLDRNRRKIELMNGLLMSMPGTPVLYYGDEIGMGDNVYLGDRDAVRTPMQWSADRNAGFSHANPQRMFLPVNIDPGSHYESVNVESAQTNPSSLLWWMKRLIALRKRHTVLARGGLEFLPTENPHVLSFLRAGDEVLLVVANLSRFSQPVELDLSRYIDRRPVEVFGRTEFPRIGELPYFLTLGPHSFFWFVLEDEQDDGDAVDGEAEPVEISTEFSRWLRGDGLKRWVGRSLPVLLPKRRWFISKERRIREVSVEEVVPLGALDEGIIDSVLTLVRVRFTRGDDEVYTLPLALLRPERVVLQGGIQTSAILGAVRKSGEDDRRVLVDASADEAFWRASQALLSGKRTVKGRDGNVVGVRVKGGRSTGGLGEEEVRVARIEQSNSSAMFGQRSVMKLYRKVDEGMNPDFEIGRHLAGTRRFNNTPTVQGALEYRRNGALFVLATLQEYVSNEGDAWQHSVDAVGRYLERTVSLTDKELAQGAPRGGVLDHVASEIDAQVIARMDGYLDSAELLGQRTGELHLALADSEDAEFIPEPITKLYLRSLYQTLRNGIRRSMQTLKRSVDDLEGESRHQGEQLIERREEMLEIIDPVRDLPPEGVRIRCHGDFHLGQVLWTGKDFSIIDFEGDSQRPLSERRLKRSPLTDVAWMCRSLDYAACAGLLRVVEQGMVTAELDVDATLWRQVERWSFHAQAAYLRGYLNSVVPPLIPSSVEVLRPMLEAWMLYKGASEIVTELSIRPGWVWIPVRGILKMLDEIQARNR